MIAGNLSFSSGLSLRPAVTADRGFLETLYRASRPELELLDGDDQREQVFTQQYGTFATGAGDNYPEAIHFVIEKAATSIGSVVVDFGHNEVRIVYLAFIPAARGKGFGSEVVRGMQAAAERVRSPLVAVVWRSNPQARQVYLDLGFSVQETQLVAERLIWYPGETRGPVQLNRI